MKGDRRRRGPSDGEGGLELTWRGPLIDFDRSVEGARAFNAALGVASSEAALQACASVASAMGVATAPLLDPRLGIDLMRLHHAFDDIVLEGTPPRSEQPRDAAARVVERRRVGESALTVVECTIDTRATWRAGFLSRGPRRAHKDTVLEELGLDDEIALGSNEAERVRLTDDARHLAARATGDHDPLVVDDRVAENAGLPRAIVPPRALALVAWCVLTRANAETPQRLRAIHARTIAWGDDATVRVSPDGRACRVVDDEGALLCAARVESA